MNLYRDTIELIDAISTGMITPEELIAKAFVDYRQGMCGRLIREENGLSRYDFHYANLDFCVTSDVYRAPKGGEYAIHAIAFFPPGESSRVALGRYAYSECGEIIDIYEKDWGLSFSVSNVRHRELTLSIEQNGGQQPGIYQADHYSLYRCEGESLTEVKRVCPPEQVHSLWPSFVITSNKTMKTVIDWTDMYGELPVGEYVLYLTVNALIDEQQYSMNRNHTDTQRYPILFEVR